MEVITLKSVGNSTGVILPKESLDKFRLKKGDQLFLSETKEGFQLRVYREDFAAEVEAAEHVMQEYRNALKELAK